MKASELDRKTGLFKRTVTHEQAREAFRQYHHALYHNEPRPALHVPVDPNDADVVLGDYIRQSAERLTELEQATPHLAINREFSDLREKWNAAERRVTELEQALATLLDTSDEVAFTEIPFDDVANAYNDARAVAEALLERQKESG